MVVFKGRWHSVRKTIVGTLIDKEGNRYKVRFLIDSGATVSMILMHSLFLTKGNWDFGTTPVIKMHGINAVSTCDLMVEAKFAPGPHIPESFLISMGKSADFNITLQFFVQKDVRAYRCPKQELTPEVRKELAKQSYTLADPNQNTEGDEILYVHGIIGEDQIGLLEEHNIRKLVDSGMKVTRTLFGDLLHGNSHFLDLIRPKGEFEMKQPAQAAACSEIQSASCSEVCLYGLIAEISTSEDKEDPLENIDFLRNITQ
jgi:hypothetical protein